MRILQAANLVSGLTFLVVAAVIIRRRGLKDYITPFLWFCLVNLIGVIAVIIETTDRPGFWELGYFLLFAYLAFLPSTFYWLGNRWGLYQSEWRWHQKIFSRTAFLISFALFLILWFGRSVDLMLSGSRWYIDLGHLHFWISVFLILAVTGGMYALETCYRSSLGLTRENLRKTFFPLLAGGIGLLAMATVTMLYHQISDLMLTVTFVLMAVVTVTSARHYITFLPGEQGVILTRKGIYSSIVVVLVGIYFIVIGLIGHILVRYNLDDGLFFSVAFLILLVLTFMLLVISQTLRSRLREVSRPKLPAPRKGVFAEEWKEFTEEVSVLLNIEMIFDRTNRLLHRLLKIEHSLFVIREAASSSNFTIYTGDGIDRGIPGGRLENLTRWLHRYAHPIETTALAEKAPREVAELEALSKSSSFNIFLLVPFIARQQFLGFWGIGHHQTGRELTSEEIGFIEAAANPVALTILSARITDELVISREMESFHRISSFVMHDLKNSVAMLSMLLQNAEKNMGNPEFQREALVTIAKAVDRQKKIISRLTGQTTDEKPALTRIEIADLIRGALERTKLESLKSIELRFEVDSGKYVVVDPEKVGSVFDNLVMNAVEAMPKGGRLEIRLADHQLPGMVVVSFTDNGRGMDDEFISTRLFKPFSSTKPHGLGIGMYQSQEIIKAHRGRIEVKSKPGEGSQFLVYLPGEE